MSQTLGWWKINVEGEAGMAHDYGYDDIRGGYGGGGKGEPDSQSLISRRTPRLQTAPILSSYLFPAAQSSDWRQCRSDFYVVVAPDAEWWDPEEGFIRIEEDS